MDDTQLIIVSGDPRDGFQHHGPFDDAITAVEWASQNIDEEISWWTTVLYPPSNTDN
jgi:bisphosphoglycerate-independent phosphoglycerate mutase (AlkP superfamily)